ncbi:MAG: PEGA domain-containing protein [Deltaproteobacteria bacterium]|nr:PEGA domain-containing protein [Deltaproteobacteria bacterium]
MFVVTSLLCAFFVPEAEAQVGAPWLIIPTTASTDAPWMEPTAQAFRRELWDRGIEVWSLERAANRFEKEESEPAARLSEVELQNWEAQSNAALRKLAAGDFAQALDQLDAAQELARGAPEELNRDPARAQKVLDTCLYMVRALMETGSESLANRLAKECRQLVLRGEPTALMHPPSILESLARVDAARAEQTGEIRIESTPSSCPVRINGVMLGETPFEIGELFSGRYRVQVECEPGQPTRVHTADVGFTRTDVFIDARFDAVVETRPFLYLRYADPADEARNRTADAERIAKAVPAGALLLMYETSANTVELELLRGAPAERRALTRVTAGPEGPNPGDLALAVRALIDGKCVDFTEPEPLAVPCREEPDTVAEQPVPDDGWPPHRTPRGQFITGLTLAGIGSAALITGYVLLAPRASAAEDWINLEDLLEAGMMGVEMEATAAQQKWLNLRSAIIATASVGGAALVAAMPLALPKREKTPWWAWLSGGLGVGLAAFSVYYGVTADAEPSGGCAASSVDGSDARACVKRGEQVSLAILTGVSAAPLLTVPLVYLFRPSDKDIAPSIEVSRSGGYVSVRGRF